MPGKSRKSRKGNPKSHKSSKSRKATSDMSLTEIQNIARTKGIPFGGLTKSRLIRRVNKY